MALGLGLPLGLGGSRFFKWLRVTCTTRGCQEGEGDWMPLELLTWYLPTLESDADRHRAVYREGVCVGGGDNFFALICTQNSCY